jgi:hypothetical protein
MSHVQSFGETGSVPGMPGIETVTGNDGLPAAGAGSPVNVNIVGNNTQGVNVTRTAADTETITVADATTTQKGVVELATNAETIAGTDSVRANTPASLAAKLGAQTSHGLAYGAGTAAAIAWLGEAANGQIPIGQTGGVPVLGNITSLDGSVTVTNGAGTIDLSVVGNLSGTATSTNGSTENLITIPLGVTAACYRFTFTIAARDTGTGDGLGYSLEGTVKTDGATATLVAAPFTDNDEDASLLAASIDLVASANSAILQVTGVVGQTIAYKAVGSYVAV